MYYLLMKLLQPFPLGIITLGFLVGYVCVRKTYRRWFNASLLTTYAILVLVSSPAVSYFALGSLEWRYPPRDNWPADAEAIVVLSGDVLSKDRIRLRDRPGPISMQRCFHATEIYDEHGPLPILVTGGMWDIGHTPCAPLMRDFLVQLGIPEDNIVVESQSQSTFENARESRKLLEKIGIRKVILVTDASHMHRSVLAFRKQGLEVVPSACYHRATGPDSAWYLNCLPSPLAISLCHAACHEWLGIMWYRYHGRI